MTTSITRIAIPTTGATTVPRAVPLAILEEESEEPTLVIPRKRIRNRLDPSIATPAPRPASPVVLRRRRRSTSIRQEGAALPTQMPTLIPPVVPSSRERFDTLISTRHPEHRPEVVAAALPLGPVLRPATTIDPFARIGFSRAQSIKPREPIAFTYMFVTAIALGVLALAMSPPVHTALSSVAVVLTR